MSASISTSKNMDGTAVQRGSAASSSLVSDSGAQGLATLDINVHLESPESSNWWDESVLWSCAGLGERRVQCFGYADRYLGKKLNEPTLRVHARLTPRSSCRGRRGVPQPAIRRTDTLWMRGHGQAFALILVPFLVFFLYNSKHRPLWAYTPRVQRLEELRGRKGNLC